jgi:hypothetical protein
MKPFIFIFPVFLIACSSGINYEAEVYGEDHIIVVDRCRVLKTLDESDFDIEIRVTKNSLGYARIRANDSFSSSDTNNVLAHAKCWSVLKARVPDRYRNNDGTPFRKPYCYEVLIEDASNCQCVGYISESVVIEEVWFQEMTKSLEDAKKHKIDFPELYKDNPGLLTLHGRYYGKNVYVQNPFAGSGSGFCVTYFTVNGRPTTREVSSSAFEIRMDNHYLDIGDPVIIRLDHRIGCYPKVLNPGVLDSAYMYQRYNMDSIALEVEKSMIKL